MNYTLQSLRNPDKYFLANVKRIIKYKPPKVNQYDKHLHESIIDEPNKSPYFRGHELNKYGSGNYDDDMDSNMKLLNPRAEWNQIKEHISIVPESNSIPKLEPIDGNVNVIEELSNVINSPIQNSNIVDSDVIETEEKEITESNQSLLNDEINIITPKPNSNSNNISGRKRKRSELEETLESIADNLSNDLPNKKTKLLAMMLKNVIFTVHLDSNMESIYDEHLESNSIHGEQDLTELTDKYIQRIPRINLLMMPMNRFT